MTYIVLPVEWGSRGNCVTSLTNYHPDKHIKGNQKLTTLIYGPSVHPDDTDLT